MLLCAEIDVMFVVVGSRKGQAQRYQTRLWEYRQIVVKNNRYSFCHYYSFSYIWREMGTTYLHKPFEKLRKLSFRHQNSDICMVARSPITVSRFSAKISWNHFTKRKLLKVREIMSNSLSSQKIFCEINSTNFS